MCIWNSDCKPTAWSTSLSPRVADEAGLAQFDFTRPVSRKKLARAFSLPGVEATAILAATITWWHGNETAVALDSNFKLLFMSRILVAVEKWWHHVIIWIKHNCVCIVGVKLPQVLSRRRAITRAAPSWSPGTARQHPREFDTNNTHTIMFDPDYNMMPPFFHSNQYSAHEKQFEVWIESNRSLRCHVTTLLWRQVWQSPPPPVKKMHVPVFCGRLDVWNRTAPDRLHLLPVATTKLIMRWVYNLNFRCTLSFSMKMTSSTQLRYICASAGRYVFRWDRLLDEGLAFVQAGVPSCPDDVTLR